MSTDCVRQIDNILLHLTQPGPIIGIEPEDTGINKSLQAIFHRMIVSDFLCCVQHGVINEVSDSSYFTVGVKSFKASVSINFLSGTDIIYIKVGGDDKLLGVVIAFGL